MTDEHLVGAYFRMHTLTGSGATLEQARTDARGKMIAATPPTFWLVDSVDAGITIRTALNEDQRIEVSLLALYVADGIDESDWLAAHERLRSNDLWANPSNRVAGSIAARRPPLSVTYAGRQAGKQARAERAARAFEAGDVYVDTATLTKSIIDEQRDKAEAEIAAALRDGRIFDAAQAITQSLYVSGSATMHIPDEIARDLADPSVMDKWGVGLLRTEVDPDVTRSHPGTTRVVLTKESRGEPSLSPRLALQQQVDHLEREIERLTEDRDRVLAEREGVKAEKRALRQKVADLEERVMAMLDEAGRERNRRIEAETDGRFAEAQTERLRRENIRMARMLASPPGDWVAYGSSAFDDDAITETWGTDKDGLPLWERKVGSL